MAPPGPGPGPARLTCDAGPGDALHHGFHGGGWGEWGGAALLPASRLCGRLSGRRPLGVTPGSAPDGPVRPGWRRPSYVGHAHLQVGLACIGHAHLVIGPAPLSPAQATGGPSSDPGTQKPAPSSPPTQIQLCPNRSFCTGCFSHLRPKSQSSLNPSFVLNPNPVFLLPPFRPDVPKFLFSCFPASVLLRNQTEQNLLPKIAI